MNQYLSDIWRLRYFWMSLVQVDLRTRYRRSVLGIGWSMLHPIAMTIVICTVFHCVFGLDVRKFGPSVLVGLCFWNFVTATTQFGCHCFLQGEPYIRQYPAPIAIYPLRTVLGASFHFLMTLCIVILATWFLAGFGNLATLPLLVPTFALLLIFGWSLAVLLGFAHTYFHDTAHLAEVGLQVAFYSTPIIWPEELLRHRGYGWIVDLNPLAALVQLIRTPILAAAVPPLSTIVLGSLTVLVTFALAVGVLVKLQRTLVFHL